jgi:thiamine-monophosphate kinase
MTEFDLIARLTKDLPSHAGVVVGVGDDCAVLDLGLPDRWVLFKTDAVVEGVHFTGDALPEQIGHKALARCLSDIAAMGGEPSSALITLGLPPTFEVDRIEGIYRGFNALAARHSVAVVGGETTTNPERVFLSIALLGEVEKTRCIRRAGAQVGDALFVSGTLGGSLRGRHLCFEPRVKEARWLTEHFAVHAMIDLSDGLAGDLRHLLAAGQVGAELLATAIPISREAKLAARETPGGKAPLLAALTDGEDFELLFTVAGRDAVRLLDAWRARFPELRLTCIGRIIAERQLRLRDRNGVRALDAHGYVHFA